MRLRFSAKISAFTIVELLVAAAITVLIVVLLGTMFGSLTNTSSRASHRIDAFRDARAALQMMERDLSGLVRTQWEPDPFSNPPPAPGASQPRTRPAAYLALKNMYADPGTGNDQLYALVAAKNSGPSDVCSVGYYCRWDDQLNAYSLRRFFHKSDATLDVFNSPSVSGANYASEADLYTPDPIGTLPNAMHDEILASYVWNLRVIAYDAAGNVIARPPTGYVCDPSATVANPLPAAIEVSFNAMSPAAAKMVMNVSSDPMDWMDSTRSRYKLLVGPNAYEFRTRIKF